MISPRNFTALILFACVLAASAQQPSANPRDYTPPELQATGPHVKALIDGAEAAAEDGNYPESLQKLQQALEFCAEKKFLGDQSLVEARLAAGYFMRGRLEQAKRLWLNALSGSIRTGNLVLQADILVSLSSMAQSSGNAREALSLSKRALEAARKSGSFYIESRALGELGRLQLAAGQRAEAQTSLEEALRLDRLNQYGWEASHLLYLAWLTASDASGLDRAIPLLQSARELAIRHENYLVFLQASASLARAYVQKGRAGEGISLLEHSRRGVDDDGHALFRRPVSYRSAMSLPYPRAAFLEAFAQAYQEAQRTEDAIRSWQELHDLAKASGFSLAAAGAAHAIADLHQKEKNSGKAALYYALAAAGWAGSGNLPRRMDALSGEAYALFQLGEHDRALRIEEELWALEESSGEASRRFLTDLFMAEILQPRGEMERTGKALADAESLLSPDLNLPGVKPGAVLELFERLAGLHEKKNEGVLQLIDLEKAMTPAEGSGEEARQRIGRGVRERLGALSIRELAEKTDTAGDLFAALEYFELLQHFEQTDAHWSGQADSYMDRADNGPLKRIVAIPHRLIEQPGGPELLETNLRQMGPIAERASLSIQVALARYYTREGRPEKVVQFASAALPWLRLGDQDQPLDFDVELVCELAYAHLLQRDIESAARQAAPCLASAKKLGDQRRLAMAHQINVWILQAAGREPEAQESARFLTQYSPDDPVHYVELAQLKTGQGEHAEAAEAWRRALALYEVHSDWKGTASTHLSLAYSLGLKNDEALGHLQTAISLYHQLGDLQSQARATALIGVYFAHQKQPDKAFQSFDDALRLARGEHSAGLEAYILSEIGNACRNAGELTQALDSYRKSAGLYHQTADADNESSQLQNQAAALDALHQSEEALATGLRAQHLAENSGSWLQRYWARRVLAGLYEARGDLESALASLREAREIANAADQPLNSAQASLAIAQTLDVAGDREAAVDAVNLALPVFRRLNDHAGERAALRELMDIYGARESEFKDLDKSLGYYRSAREIAEKYDPSEAASLNLDAVEIYRQQNRFRESLTLANEALDYYRRRKDELGEAGALLSLAEVQRSSGSLQAAAGNLKRAEPLIEHSSDAYTAARFHYGLANQHKAEGRLRDAIEEYNRVVDLLEGAKAAAGPALRRRVSETYGYIYNELIDTWFRLAGKDETSRLPAAAEALRLSELNKSRVFSATWGRTFVDALRRQLPAALQEDERKLTAREISLQSELAQAMSGQGSRPAKQVQDDLQLLSGEIASLQKKLRDANPAYAEARYPRSVAMADIPLRPGELLVEFRMLDDALMVWMLKGEGAGAVNVASSGPRLAAFYKVDHPRAWFEERILALRSAFNRGFPDQFEPQSSEELFNAIFPPPYAQRLTAAREILFVPDDVLFLLPFEMLSPRASHSQFVLLKTPTSYFPSAAALRLSRSIARVKRAWPAQFFALADPITSTDDERYGTASMLSEVEALVRPVAAGASPAAGSSPPSTAAASQPREPGTQAALRGQSTIARLKTRGYFFERLPETANEARHIAALFPTAESTTIRTGPDATKRELLQTELARFRYLHFATHGFLPVEPGIHEPALVLSYDGRAEDRMMLILSEVVQLRLQADMVVLSACNTGSGRVTRAEGVASLGMSFLAAGASSVTVSLWQVADESTAILMEEYYRNLLRGMPTNAALAAARAAIIAKGYANPFYWAPFVLTGE